MSDYVKYSIPMEVGNLWFKLNYVAGFETRLVGGAVRDLVMGHTPKDYDFCTTATPDQMVAFAEQYGYRIEPTGMQHGTVSFIIDGVAYEFTTLRVDTDCDGRHATVEFTTDFEADAARRDFTFNAMSADIDGAVWDYFGGMEDAKNKVVRFVGSADERIAEDYLRVLRFFRFAARYDAIMDEDALTVMRRAGVHSGLGEVSRERIWAEVSKIAVSPAREAAVAAMVSTGVATAIGLEPNIFAGMCVQNAKNAPSFMAGFCGIDPVQFGRDWKMSNDDGALMTFVHDHSQLSNKFVAGMRLDGVKKDWVVSACEVHAPELVEFARSDFPTFPMSGKDLLEEGFQPGPAMGHELSRRRKVWKDSILKEVP